MARFLIIPGIAKAGTTFLFDRLSREPEFNPSRHKELNYNWLSGSYEAYTALFQQADDVPIRLDASPEYMQRPFAALQAMRQVLDGHDVKVIVAIREPFAQMFSHYCHDLKRHVAHFDLRERMMIDHQIRSVNGLGKYLIPRAPALLLMQELFGAENVMLFSLKHCGADPEFGRALADFLGLERDLTLDFAAGSNVGGWVPFVTYAARRDIEVYEEDSVYLLRRGDLLIRNGPESRLLRQPPPAFAEILVRNAEMWDREFRPSWLGAAAETVREDYRACLAACGVADFEESEREVYRAGLPALSAQVRGDLKRLASTPTTARTLWQSNAALQAEGARPHAENETLPHNHDRYKRRIVRQTAKGDLTGRADAIAAFLEEFEFSPVWLERLIATLIRLGDWPRIEETLARHAPTLGFVNIPKSVAEAENCAVLDDDDRAKLAAALGEWAPARLTPAETAPSDGELPV